MSAECNISEKGQAASALSKELAQVADEQLVVAQEQYRLITQQIKLATRSAALHMALEGLLK
jgi:hypothetical protein